MYTRIGNSKMREGGIRGSHDIPDFVGPKIPKFDNWTVCMILDLLLENRKKSLLL